MLRCVEGRELDQHRVVQGEHGIWPPPVGQTLILSAKRDILVWLNDCGSESYGHVVESSLLNHGDQTPSSLCCGARGAGSRSAAAGWSHPPLVLPAVQHHFAIHCLDTSTIASGCQVRFCNLRVGFHHGISTSLEPAQVDVSYLRCVSRGAEPICIPIAVEIQAEAAHVQCSLKGTFQDEHTFRAFVTQIAQQSRCFVAKDFESVHKVGFVALPAFKAEVIESRSSAAACDDRGGAGSFILASREHVNDGTGGRGTVLGEVVAQLLLDQNLKETGYQQRAGPVILPKAHIHHLPVEEDHLSVCWKYCI
mmetsp:Transcript_17809/g.39281  ORF Transcript_17809/g.39281 Transcript_17809/m.39281 type:complete len:308 (-) Transcript_17809:78-1001(-)